MSRVAETISIQHAGGTAARWAMAPGRQCRQTIRRRRLGRCSNHLIPMRFRPMRSASAVRVIALGLAFSLMMPLAPPAAALDGTGRQVEATRQAGADMLDQMSWRMDRRQGRNGGLDLDALALVLATAEDRTEEIAFGALSTGSSPKTRRLGLFAGGSVRWEPGAMTTDSATLGADLELDPMGDMLVGMAVGMASSPDPLPEDETGPSSVHSLGLYASHRHDGPSGPPMTLRLALGLGEADLAGMGGLASWQAAEMGVSFAPEQLLIPELSVAPRLLVAYTGAAGGNGEDGWFTSRALDGLAAIDLQFNDWLMLGRRLLGRLELLAEAAWGKDLGRWLGLGQEAPLRTRMNAGPAPRLGSALRLGARLEEGSGMVWSLDHVSEPRNGEPHYHAVQARVMLPF